MLKHMLNILLITVILLAVVAAIAVKCHKDYDFTQSYREYEYRQDKVLFDPKSKYIPKSYARDGTPYN